MTPLMTPSRALLQEFLPSESFARNQDEEDTETSVDEEGDGKDHDRAFGEKFADVRLADAREVERGVFAEADEREDGIERILVRSKEIYAQSEWKDDL